MVALRSLEYEPQPTPHGRAQEADTVREERRRDHEDRCAEWEAEDERESYAIEGGIGNE